MRHFELRPHPVAGRPHTARVTMRFVRPGSLVAVTIVGALIGAGAAAPGFAAPSAPAGVTSASSTKPTVKKLTPTLETKHAASAVIDPDEGGVVRAKAANGIVYTLSIDAGTMLSPEKVTLTPIKSAKGLPKGVSSTAGVKMTPSGLTFTKPARLRIHYPKAPSKATVSKQTVMTFEGSGTGPAGALIDPNGTNTDFEQAKGDRHDEVVLVQHFSGVEVTNRIVRMTPAGDTLQKTYDKIVNDGQKHLQQAHADDVSGKGADPSDLTAARTDLEKAWDQVAEPLLKQVANDPDLSFSEVTHAISLALGVVRQEQLLGLPEKSTNDHQLMTLARMNTYLRAYFARAAKQCHDSAYPPAFVRALLGAARQAQLVGADTGDEMSTISKCMLMTFAVTSTGSSTVAANGTDDISVHQDLTDLLGWSGKGGTHLTTGYFDPDTLTFLGTGDFATTGLSGLKPAPGAYATAAKWNQAQSYDGTARIVVQPDFYPIKGAPARVWVRDESSDQQDLTITYCPPGGSCSERDKLIEPMVTLARPLAPFPVPIDGSANAPRNPNDPLVHYTAQGTWHYKVVENSGNG